MKVLSENQSNQILNSADIIDQLKTYHLGSCRDFNDNNERIISSFKRKDSDFNEYQHLIISKQQEELFAITLSCSSQDKEQITLVLFQLL